MLHAIKTPTILAACLVIAAGCSSGTVSQPQASATAASSESASTLKASPVNLQKLASLSASDTQQFAKTPASPRIGQRIEPAKTVTFERDTLIEGESQLDVVPLPVIHPESTLLDGTVYRSTTFSAPKRPKIDPGTYRTIEYK